MERVSSENAAEVQEKVANMKARKEELKSKIQRLKMRRHASTILIVGGEGKQGWFTGEKTLDTMIILNGDEWMELSIKLPKKFSAGGAVYLNDALYIFGGSLGKEAYKLDNNMKWKRLADMNEDRTDISNSCFGYNGSIWVFGGYKLKSVERYDPSKDKWIKMPDMQHPRYQAAAAVDNGKFVVCGGKNGENYLKSVECFDPKSGVWTELNDIPISSAGHSLLSFGNGLTLLGGSNKEKYLDVALELSSPKQNEKWKMLPSMAQSRAFFSTAVLDNEVFVIGGQFSIISFATIVNINAEIFDGKTWNIDIAPHLSYSCWKMSSVVIPPHFAYALHTCKDRS